MIFNIINWIISSLVIFAIIINVIYTLVYLYKINYSHTFDFTDFFIGNSLSVFGCTVNVFLAEPNNMPQLFVAIIFNVAFLALPYIYSYDKVYSKYERQLKRLKQNKLNKTIKI
jgi:hypothetical protein